MATRARAQEIIANLLLETGSTAALRRVRDEARFAKQSDEEIAYRAAGNLLNSFVVRKPGGSVVW